MREPEASAVPLTKCASPSPTRRVSKGLRPRAHYDGTRPITGCEAMAENTTLPWLTLRAKNAQTSGIEPRPHRIMFTLGYLHLTDS